MGRRFVPIVMDRKCVCTSSLRLTSHSTILFHFGGSSRNSEIAYGRDPCHLQAEGTRGGDVSPQSCFQGKYYLHWSSPPTASWHGSLGRQAAGVSPPTRQDRTAVVKGMPRGGSCSSPKDLLDNCLVRQRKLYYLLWYSLKKALLGNFQVVRWLELGPFTAGSWVQFLVGELRSCKPRGAAPVPQKHLFRLSVVSQKREVRDGYLEF